MEKENGMINFLFFHKIHRTFASENKVVRELHNKEFVILVAIEKIGEKNDTKKVKVSDLVKFLEVSNADVSRTLKNIEAKNLIIRETDKKDRRNVFVQLTDEGITCLNDAKKSRDKQFMKITEKMGKEKMDLLWELLDELGNILKEEAELTKENTKGT